MFEAEFDSVRSEILVRELFAGEWHFGCPHEAVIPVCTSLRLTATMRRSHQHETGSTPESGFTFMKP